MEATDARAYAAVAVATPNLGRVLPDRLVDPVNVLFLRRTGAATQLRSAA